MAYKRVLTGVTVAALIALGAAVSPAAGASGKAVRHKPRVTLSENGGIGAFTPAATDARLAAALARSGLSTSGFRFTPASSVRLNRSVTVAVRARSTNAGPAVRNERVALVSPTASAIAPVAYNLGVAVGWRRFAVSGDLASVDIDGLGKREAVDVGLSYNTRKWSTKLQVGADRATGPAPTSILGGSGYSFDVGGTYALTHNLNVTAGLRYRADRDRLLVRDDDRRDSQAVYVGTAIRF